MNIRIANMGRERIDGLVVRELLPRSWRPVNVRPQAVYRDTVVMWLVDLGPYEEQVLELRVKADEPGANQSLTEVSMATAVRAPVPVSGELRRRPAPNYGTNLPIVQLPRVKLTLEELPSTVTVGEWLNVHFRVENVGTAPAEGVSLRIDLPHQLDHRTLDADDANRRVESNVAQLGVNESRTMTLAVRANSSGRHLSIAQLMLQDKELDLRDFEIVAEEAPPIMPVPDFN